MSAEAIEHAHGAEGGEALAIGLRQQVGILLLIIADAAFVASLMFTYFYLRGLNTDGGWIPRGSPTLSIPEAWLIALVIVASAAAYRWGQRGIWRGDVRRLMTGTTLAMTLLLADLALQIYRLATLPFVTTTGSYASVVITMAGAHVVHLLITAVLGVGIWIRARKGLFTEQSHWHVRLVGYWWTWVAVSAILFAATTSILGK